MKGLPNIRSWTSWIGNEVRLIQQHPMQGGAKVNYTLEGLSPRLNLMRFTGVQFTATVKVVKK